MGGAFEWGQEKAWCCPRRKNLKILMEGKEAECLNLFEFKLF